MISESAFNKKPPPLKLILIALAGIAILVAAYFAWQYFAAPKDDAAKNQATVKRVVTEVGTIYLLPEGEPSVIQVQDKDKLKDQPFYQKAQNGDYVLVYEKDKLAVIYRDTVKKIVNAGPIIVDGQQPNN